MQIIVQDITPEKAAKWLTKNTDNRILNKDRVRMYAHDMKAGRWAVNGVPIVFSADGKILKDGQHRLAASVESGVTLKGVPVMFVDDESATNYDVGLPRSVADLAVLQGKEDSYYRNKTIRSAVTFLICRHLNIRDNRVISKPQILETMINNKALMSPLISVIRAGGLKHGRNLSGGGAAAIIAAYSNNYDIDELQRFASVYYSGFPEPGRPQDVTAIALRNYALSHSLRGTKELEGMYLQTQYALRLYAEGEKRQLLRGLRMSEHYKMKWIVEP